MTKQHFDEEHNEEELQTGLDLIHEVQEEVCIREVANKYNTWIKEPETWQNGERKISPIGILEEAIDELPPSSEGSHNHYNKI